MTDPFDFSFDANEDQQDIHVSISNALNFLNSDFSFNPPLSSPDQTVESDEIFSDVIGYGPLFPNPVLLPCVDDGTAAMLPDNSVGDFVELQPYKSPLTNAEEVIFEFDYVPSPPQPSTDTIIEVEACRSLAIPEKKKKKSQPLQVYCAGSQSISKPPLDKINFGLIKVESGEGEFFFNFHK